MDMIGMGSVSTGLSGHANPSPYFVIRQIPFYLWYMKNGHEFAGLTPEQWL